MAKRRKASHCVFIARRTKAGMRYMKKCPGKPAKFCGRAEYQRHHK